MNASEVQKAWVYLGVVEQNVLEDARFQLHHAFQLVGDVCLTFVPLEAQPGKMDIEWWPQAQALAGATLAGSPPFRVALALADCCLLITDADGENRARMPLDGQTRAEAVAWLGAELGARGVDAVGLGAGVPTEVPAHPAAEGAPFSCSDSDGFEEVARYYANAWNCLSFARGLGSNPSSIRMAPREFGLHTTIGLETDGAPTTTLDISFQPGDDECDEFYFCVKADPTLEVSEDQLGELEGGGEWHAHGWFGTLLRMSECRFYEAEPMQADAVTMYLDSTVDELRALLRGAWPLQRP